MYHNVNFIPVLILLVFFEGGTKENCTFVNDLDPKSIEKPININIDSISIIITDSISNNTGALKIRSTLYNQGNLIFNEFGKCFEIGDSNNLGDWIIFDCLPIKNAFQTISFYDETKLLKTITNRTPYKIGDTGDSIVIEGVIYEITLLKGEKQNLYFIRHSEGWISVESLYDNSGIILWLNLSSKETLYCSGDLEEILKQFGIQENIFDVSSIDKIILEPCQGKLYPKIH